MNKKQEFGYGLLALVCLGFLLFPLFTLSGCATAPTTANTADVKVIIARKVITDLVPAVLNNNPQYEPALVAIIDGVDVVFAKGTLTAEDVSIYIDLIGRRYAMDTTSRILIGNAILDLFDLYRERAGVKVATTDDPKFVTLLESFRTDVREGIRRYHVFKTAAK